MTIQVEISPEAEAQLAAGARGIPVAKYAGTLLQEALAPSRGGAGMLTLENVDAFSKNCRKDRKACPSFHWKQTNGQATMRIAGK